MNHLPLYVPAVFVAVTFLTIYFFYKASKGNTRLLMLIAAWMTIQSAVAATGFFEVENSLPPRFVLLIAIPLIAILVTLSRTKARSFVEGFDIRTLTLLHSVRIAIEMVLFWLFLSKAVPQLMTFEGRNFDIISGLTAPLIYYFGFVKGKMGTKSMLAWNVVCLAILLFTVGNAILSAPTPLQRFAYDQPTIAVLYFPFVWLPGVVVPIVVFSHLVTIRLLVNQMKEKNVATSSLCSKQVA